MTFTIAIDGPAAAGKGTLSKKIAETFGFAHLDTGLLYRATALKVLDGQSPIEAARSLAIEDLAREGMRTPEVGQEASKVSAIPEVRAELLQFQRDFARRPGGAVLDGRDIGTVVCPEAELKIFCTANDEIRARRRHAEILAAGGKMSFEETLADLRVRDARDSQRATAPLAPAEDAVLLDTSNMQIDEVIAAATRLVRVRIGERGQLA
jgi:CMP/dCMP kinase